MEQDNTGYRSIEFTIKNHSDQNLFLWSENFSHGRWDVEESQKPKLIEKGKETWFKVCSKDAALIGVDGELTWKGGTDLANFTLCFSNPISGGNKTEVKISNPKYGSSIEGGSGNHAKTIITIYVK